MNKILILKNVGKKKTDLRESFQQFKQELDYLQKRSDSFEDFIKKFITFNCLELKNFKILIFFDLSLFLYIGFFYKNKIVFHFTFIFSFSYTCHLIKKYLLNKQQEEVLKYMRGVKEKL